MPKIKIEKQSKSELTRLRLIKAAIKIFSKKGFENGSFEEIAKLAKLSPTAPFYYFKTKDNLMEEIQSYISSHSSEVVKKYLEVSQNSVDKLRSHFIGNLTWAMENQDEVHLTLFMYYRASFSKKWATLNLAALLIARKKIETILQEGVEKKEITLPLGLKTTTELLHDALLGSLLNLMTTKSIDPEAGQTVKEKWEGLFKKVLVKR